MKWMKKKENNRKPLNRKKKRLIIVIAAGSLLVMAAGYTVFIAPLLEKEQWIYKEELVERGTLKIGVSESGSLEYGITSILYDLDLEVSSEDEDGEEEESEEVVQKYLKIEEVYVKSGQRIAEGDLLYKFTEDSVSDVRMLLQSAAVEAQSEYALAQAEYNLSALEAKAEYESQILAGEYASSIYKNDKESVENEITALQVEINQRTANIASLQEQLEEATENYNEIWADFKDAQKPSIENESNTVNFMIMQKSYLNLQTQYENAKSALSRAQQSLDENAAAIESLKKEMSALTAKKTVSKLDAEATYQENKINGENAQINYDAQMESLKETLKEAEEEKDKIQEQLDAFEAFVGEDGCLYADGSGIVTQVSYEAGDRLRSSGTLVSYATPTDMTISVDVTQEDIVDLKVGDKVDITFTAYEDTSYEGSIQSINTTATSTGSNTVSYTVVIAVEGDTTLLYGGMTADIIFVTEQKDDVLFISKKAIVEENGKTYVYYKTLLGGMELKEVEVGIDNGVNIEILSGLEEGDTIYLASRVSDENAVMSGGQNEDDEATGNAGQNPFGDMENFEVPDMENFEMPDIDFGNGSGGNMPNGGNMPGGGNIPSGGNMPGRGGR